MVRIIGSGLLLLGGCPSAPLPGTPGPDTADTASLTETGTPGSDTGTTATTHTADTGLGPHPWTSLWVGDSLSGAGSTLSIGPVHGDGSRDLLIAVPGGHPWVEYPGSEWTGAALVHDIPPSGSLRSQAEVVWDYGIDRWQGGSLSLPGDVTGDGVPDALVGIDEIGEGKRVDAYVATSATPVMAIPGSSGAFEVGDVDGDGVPELDMGEGRILAGPIGPTSTADDWWFAVPGAEVSSVAHSDYDLDGTAELLWAVRDGAASAAYLFLDPQPGSATLADADVSWTPEGISTDDPTSILALDGGRDLTGDGLPDIVFSGASASGDRMVGYVVTDLAGGSLGTATTRLEPPSPTSVVAAALGDFDGDGATDLAVGTGCESSEVWVFRGPLPPGTLTAADADVVVPVGTGCGYGDFVRSMAAGDLDGDGRDDLAVGLSNAVGVLAGGGL